MSHFCKTHPRYEAKRKPGSLCGDCWKLYFLKNPEERTVVLENYEELKQMQQDYRQAP